APGALGPDAGASRRAEEAARVRAALERAHAVELPAAGSEVDDTQAALFERTVDALGIVEDRLRDASRTPWQRRRPIASTALAILATALTITAALVHVRPDARASAYAHASATWGSSPAYKEDLAVDGEVTTAWLLPDHVSGWLDVRFTPAVTLHHVRL